MASVRIAWDYKCLGEDGGELRVEPEARAPEASTREDDRAGNGHDGAGREDDEAAARSVSAEGGAVLRARRGAARGYDKPEVGGQFTVPDYCAWTVSSVRGLVQLEQETAVKAAKAGSSVARGDVLTTPRSGKAELRAVAGDGRATLAGSSRLAVDGKHCPAKSGWKLLLCRGHVDRGRAQGCRGRKRFATATKNATVSGGPGARWKVEYAKRRTKVRALAGQVRVGGKVLKPGQTTTV